MYFYYGKRSMYFIGVGGVGMIQLCTLLDKFGFNIFGTDIISNEYLRKIKNNIIKISNKHKKKNIKRLNTLILSSAIKNTNVELLEGKKKKNILISRMYLLNKIVLKTINVCIFGTHGKTTIGCFFLIHILSSNINIQSLLGGKEDRDLCKKKKDNFSIIELDESDGLYQHLNAKYLIINNIDKDHIDFWGEESRDILNTLKLYIRKNNLIYLVICVDCFYGRYLIKSINLKKYVTYGIIIYSNFRAKNIKYKNLSILFDIIYNGYIIKNIKLNLIGIYNIYNILSIYVISRRLLLEENKIKLDFYKFQGIKRRLNVKINSNNVLFIDDYAHHPTEIGTLISSIKKSYFNHRIIVYYQSHRYSRSIYLINEFIKSFSLVDKLIIVDIFSAGENNFLSSDSSLFSEKIKTKLNIDVLSVNTIDKGFLCLKKISSKNDIVILLGAGLLSLVLKKILNN